MKILQWRWFNASNGMVGVVLVENEIKEQSVRIGCTHRSPFSLMVKATEKQDLLLIMNIGAKLSYEEAKGYFPKIKKGNYKKS